MSPTVQVSYNLHPPAPTQPPEGLREKVIHEFPIEVTGERGSSKSYYEGLQRALTDAKGVLGQELTAWRDAVGSLEKDKELHTTNEEEEGEGDSFNEESAPRWYVQYIIDKPELKNISTISEYKKLSFYIPSITTSREK